MARTDNFMPGPKSTILVTATTTPTTYQLPEGGEDIVVGNQSTTIWCYIEMGAQAAVASVVPGQPWPASSGSFPIPPNALVKLRRLVAAFAGGPEVAAQYISVVAASTTAVMTISAGTGAT